MPQRAPSSATRTRVSVLALVLVLTGTARATGPGPAEAREAALAFGHALTSADATLLRTVLPSDGKVQLRLELLGPEQGYFSTRQVEAVLADFLSVGNVRAYELLRVECEETIALIHARAALTDRAGRTARVKLHLSLRPEAGRWVVREIREVAS